MMALDRCVICSEDCDLSDDPDENRTVFTRNESSLLRLLDINVESSIGQQQSMTNSNNNSEVNKLCSLNNSIDNGGDLEKAPYYYGIYCSNCERRNHEIFELFEKIDFFNKKLEEIKTTLKNDFTDCYYQDPSSVLRDVEIVGLKGKRYQLLRTLIAKSFKLILDDPDHNINLDIPSGTLNKFQQENMVDDDYEDGASFTTPEIPDISYSEAEGIVHNETDSDFNVDNFVKKRKLKTKPVKAKKPVTTKIKKCSTTTTRSTKKRLGRRALVKLLDEEESTTNEKIRQKYHNLRDVVVQVEKLPTKYLSELGGNKKETKIFSMSRVTRGKYKKHAKIKRDLIKTEEPKVRLSCGYETCKKTFKTEEEKDYHTKKKHEGITHPFKCSECGRQFRQQKLYDVHVQSHRGYFPFTCKVCKKGFINNGALKSHAVRHTTDTPFKCDLCPRAYKGHGGLVYHKRKIHSGVHPYQCEICGASFVKSDKLTRHKASVHAKDKPIICHICGKTFTIQNYLYMHMRIHQGNPFVNKNRKKSVISSSSSLTTVNQNSSSPVVIGSGADTEFIGQSQNQENVPRIEALDNQSLETLPQPILVPQSQSHEDHYNNNPQIPTITQPRQIILTLDTSKPSNLSHHHHHHIQTDIPNNNPSNSTFVINFNKKALMTNPLGSKINLDNNDRLSCVTYSSSDPVVGQVVHDQEPHLLLTTEGGGERGGNVIVTSNSSNSNLSGPSSIHRVETLFRPTLEFTTISNQIIQQATQQGVIQYFPLSSLTEQFPNGFEFFSNQNSNNNNT